MDIKNKAIAVLTISIIAISMMAIAMPVMGEYASTTAVVDGSALTPVIEEKFELNDDGDPLPNHGTPGTQVTPVPDATKEVCVYVVASHPLGAPAINRVWITVDNENGVEVAYGDTEPAYGNIDELNYGEACIATQAAYDQGLINDARRQEINGHIDDGEWRMWKFCFELTNCDMSGDYLVTAKANDGNGGTDIIENTFEYISIKELAIDFQMVDYGTIQGGIKQIVSGDDNFGSVPPTVRNRANDPFLLQISATDMIGTVDPNSKILATNLDAHVYGIASDEELNLDYDPGVIFSPIIAPCTTEKIDFSLLQSVICQDEYSGSITLEPVTLEA